MTGWLPTFEEFRFIGQPIGVRLFFQVGGIHLAVALQVLSGWGIHLAVALQLFQVGGIHLAVALQVLCSFRLGA